MRLDKFLTELQEGTRSQVKDMIRAGRVCVNQVQVKSPDYRVHENTDCVTLDGRKLTYQRYYYYLLNKPAGVVTATRDAHDKTVLDLLSGAAGRNLSPVGRLDKDTEGLLLITNDGALAHRLLSPKKHVPKTYYVRCRGTIDDEGVEQLKQGVDIGDDTPTLPAEVELLTVETDAYSLKLTITEGRFHQVKRMVQAVGGEVVYLKRLTMGSLALDESLPLGAYRALTAEEIQELQQERK